MLTLGVTIMHVHTIPAEASAHHCLAEPGQGCPVCYPFKTLSSFIGDKFVFQIVRIVQQFSHSS